MSPGRLIALILAGSLLAPLAAWAQPKAQSPSAPPPPVSTEPQTTTASYGAWTLRCQVRRPQGGQESRLCEVDQPIVPQGQQNPIAQIGVGRPTGKGDLHVTAVLPNNISFPSTPKITNGDKDPGIELTWKRCVPGGCLADTVAKEEQLHSWHTETAENTGHLIFIDAAGRTLTVQFSFRGFGAAMDALAKEK